MGGVERTADFSPQQRPKLPKARHKIKSLPAIPVLLRTEVRRPMPLLALLPAKPSPTLWQYRYTVDAKREIGCWPGVMSKTDQADGQP